MPRINAWQSRRVRFQPELSIWDRFSYEVDDVVMAQAHKIATAYGTQARLVITQGLGHRRILSDRAVIETAVSFLAEEERQALAG